MTGRSNPQRKQAHAVPADPALRSRLRTAACCYADEQGLRPPQPMPELMKHAAHLLDRERLPRDLLSFTIVLIGNAVWQETMAAIPFDRRLLLLPQCLRHPEECKAEADAFGLLCSSCGRCTIDELEKEAEALGYVVLVAEGTTVVTRLLEQGAVDAVVGVSCLDALERSFPYLAAEAIPGLAVPLVTDGCRATRVDLEWVLETLRLKADVSRDGIADLQATREQLAAWFTPAALREVLALGDTHAEALAVGWMAAAGKRWRPLLTVLCARLLRGDSDLSMDTIRRVAVAVECFHKASLVHDDIEDDDAFRYGQATMHRRYGIPIALNVGDLLVGEGYRLIAAAGAGDKATARMVAIAAQGHHTLCLGQGEELAALREPQPLKPEQILDIFRRKTSPAFEVALRLGAVCAGCDEEFGPMLSAYSDALGIAYQVRDDLEDCHLSEGGAVTVSRAQSPSLLIALAYEQAGADDRHELLEAWRTGAPVSVPAPALARARQWLEEYKQAALRALNASSHVPLRALLTRLATRFLHGREDPEAR